MREGEATGICCPGLAAVFCVHYDLATSAVVNLANKTTLPFLGKVQQNYRQPIVMMTQETKGLFLMGGKDPTNEWFFLFKLSIQLQTGVNNVRCAENEKRDRDR
jgi:hypothetical protein